MTVEIKEFRYLPAVRRRAMLLAALAAALALALIVGLAVQWATLGWGSRGLGLLLLGMAAATARSQLGRALFRCRITPDALQVSAPPASRVVPWDTVVEVRQLRLPRLTGTASWACTLMVRGRMATPSPMYLFDDQLEDAEVALQELVRQTPHAQHLLR